VLVAPTTIMTPTPATPWRSVVILPLALPALLNGA